MKVQGKTFVVTGGGSGMGRELTLLLLKRGARVAAADINETTLKETASLAGDLQSKLSTHVLNITDRDAVLKFPEEVIAAQSAVDGLINNAGIIQHFAKINDLDFKEMERVINVNFWGMVNMTKAFLPYLLKRPEAHIANTSSMGGYLPVPGQSFYGASKAAVKLFTEALYSELQPTHVHVSAIFPGAIATNIMVNSGVSSGDDLKAEQQSKMKMTTAPDAARIIVDGIERNKFHILVGSDAAMMDFLTRLMPERATKIIYSRMRSLLPD